MSNIAEVKELILAFLKENITETLSGKEMKYEVSEISDGSFTIKSDEMILKKLLESHLMGTLNEIAELIGKDMITVHSPPPRDWVTPDVPIPAGLLEWIEDVKLASAINSSERLAIDALEEEERGNAYKNIARRIMRAKEARSALKKFGKKTGVWVWLWSPSPYRVQR